MTNSSNRKHTIFAADLQKVKEQIANKKKNKATKLQWMHGTDGAFIFPLLKLKNFSLFSLGDLLFQQNTAPFSGELQIGLYPTSLSMFGISGIHPDSEVDFNTCWGYANIRKEKSILELKNQCQKNITSWSDDKNIKELNNFIDKLDVKIIRNDFNSVNNFLRRLTVIYMGLLRAKQIMLAPKDTENLVEILVNAANKLTIYMQDLVNSYIVAFDRKHPHRDFDLSRTEINTLITNILKSFENIANKIKTDMRLSSTDLSYINQHLEQGSFPVVLCLEKLAVMNAGSMGEVLLRKSPQLGVSSTHLNTIITDTTEHAWIIKDFLAQEKLGDISVLTREEFVRENNWCGYIEMTQLPDLNNLPTGCVNAAYIRVNNDFYYVNKTLGSIIKAQDIKEGVINSFYINANISDKLDKNKYYPLNNDAVDVLGKLLGMKHETLAATKKNSNSNAP